MATVVLDVMGSDLGVATMVRGACQISLEEDIQIILVGKRVEIEQTLRETPHNHKLISIEDALVSISIQEDPRTASPESSLYRAAALVDSGRGHALVSAGNTGAVVVCAARTFRRLPGIHKVALAAVYPTRKTHGPKRDPFALLLDVGATLHVTANDLLCFALMGSVYAQIISQNPSPKVALLSNGEEPKKGAPEVVEAHRLLASQNAIYFVGNVEGVDIPKGSADVIVCEGFLGNVVLKMIEGVGEIAGAMIRSAKIKVEEAEEDVMYEPLYDQVRRFAKLTDWRHYGGAPILGLDRVVIKAHGRSTSRAIRNAIKLAARAADGGMIEKIRQGMEAILS